ncbi:MAG: hypothetical protein WDN26_07270 [Chitinophagaceae bacterium]
MANKFVTRARGDGAGAAAGTQTVWTQFEIDCIARGEVPWYSFELPKRPPMLPLFGKVKTFFSMRQCYFTSPGPAARLLKSQKMVDETNEFMITSITRQEREQGSFTSGRMV